MATRKRPAKAKVREVKHKPLRLEDPLKPKMLAILRWLESHGGERQVRMEDAAAEVGIHPASWSRNVRWLELYGAIHTVREPSRFGIGTPPLRYVQLVKVRDYERDALEIREVVRARLRPKPVKAPRFPRNVAFIDPDELALIKEQAVAEVAAAIEAHGKLPSLQADPLDYSDVVAWNAAFTAE